MGELRKSVKRDWSNLEERQKCLTRMSQRPQRKAGQEDGDHLRITAWGMINLKAIGAREGVAWLNPGGIQLGFFKA